MALWLCFIHVSCGAMLFFGLTHLHMQKHSFPRALPEPSSDVNPSSAQSLLEKKVSSMFELPEAEWPKLPPSSCRFHLRWFVYTSLPRNMTTDFEDDLRRRVSEGLEIPETVATEWALLQLFRTSPCRTLDPNEADLFIVPYMHHTHCQSRVEANLYCKQVSDAELALLAQSMEHFNQDMRARHLFLSINDRLKLKPQINKMPLKLTSGPLDIQTTKAKNDVIVPILNEHPRHQPSILLRRDATWWTRTRKYAFVHVASGGINQPQPRRFRESFDENFLKTKLLGGLPYVVSQSENGPRSNNLDDSSLYRDSILCPILPGDTAWQRRFFDVIFNGCLPVVLEWPSVTFPGQNSWYLPNSTTAKEAYPFFGIDVDYETFVITAPGNLTDIFDVSSLRFTMESILSDAQQLRRRQLNMKKYALRLTYGLGMDAHQEDDAFSRITKVLERYTLSLTK